MPDNATTQQPRPFLESFPWMPEAVANASPPSPWDATDVPEVLATIASLCSWLGPFLPAPEIVAIAGHDLQGQSADSLEATQYPAATELLADLRSVISYLAMIGAGLEVLTNDSGQ